MARRRGHGDGSIYFEASRARWVGVVDLPGPGGKRRRTKVTGRTKTGVRDRLKELQRQADAGLPIGNGSITFGQFLERWLADVVPARSGVRSPNTVGNYRWAIENHLRPALGSRQLRSLSPEDIKTLLRSMCANGLAKSSIAQVRMVAATALRHAQRRGIVARNAAELADLPGNTKGPAEGRSLSPEEALSLLQASASDPIGTSSRQA